MTVSRSTMRGIARNKAFLTTVRSRAAALETRGMSVDEAKGSPGYHGQSPWLGRARGRAQGQGVGVESPRAT